MILTNCAACAAPLAHDAPRCVRCKTRYCDATCQHDHWRRGHKQICKRIHRGGNAEQYYADQKYKEAVAEAVEACADDTKGQTCFICTQALHWKTKEGLVRGCACRGTAGFAHVSCLAEQAKILVAEAEDNNLKRDGRFWRWHTCSLCKQRYHGVVICALGWACWKTYVGRPETDWSRGAAMTELGNGLFDTDLEDATSVYEAEMATMRRVGASEQRIMVVQGNLAGCYAKLKRHHDCCRIMRDVYATRTKLLGPSHLDTVSAAYNLAIVLRNLRQYEEVRSLLRKNLPNARVRGNLFDSMRFLYANSFVEDEAESSADDLREAVATLSSIEAKHRQVLGKTHPETRNAQVALIRAQRVLDARTL